MNKHHEEQSQFAESPLNDHMLKIKDVCNVTKMSKNAIYRNMKEGLFPRPYRLGIGICVGWKASSINTWMENLEQKT